MPRVRDYLKKPFQHLSRSTTPEPSPTQSNCPEQSDTVSQNNTSHPTWIGLKKFAAVLSASGDLFGPLKSAIDVFVDFIETSEAAAGAHEEHESLRAGLERLFDDLAERFGESIPPGMRPSIMELTRGIERELAVLQPKEPRHGLGRYSEAVQDADKVLKCYRRIQTLLERLALNANVNIWMLVDEQATCYRLDKLSPSHAAWYCSAESKELYRDECTPDTRIEVLERFKVWRDDDQSEKIYWLNGMAGTGKTTLTFTLCKQLEDDGRLAANFFCPTYRSP
ncbi:hypothetical protein FRC08_002671 [Ceratobasidium sp. 394]|nr:hypothetical protein FRC08_002671 [Ceratobasidium sp. 394]